jgi:tRNA/tmRNA/rRNA uracil-C5-methylase (TrmA/RlmC/RlmD family)
MNYQTGEVVQVTTVDVAHGGWCVARPDGGPVVFVRHALPGETVLARVTEITSRLARADAVEILEPSPDRVEPPCPHAHPGGCGGCDWQHAARPAQRSLKAAVVRQQLRRMAGIDREVTVEPLPGDQDAEPLPPPGDQDAEPLPPPGDQDAGPSTAPGPEGPGLGWRTRVQFAVRPDGVAGLRAHRSHEVIDVGECLIAHPAVTDLGLTRRRWSGVASVEGVVAAGSKERAVIITPAGKSGATKPSASGAAKASGSGAAKASAGRSAKASGSGAAKASASRSVSIEGIAADSVLRRAGRALTPMRGHAYLSQRAAGRDWRVSAGVFWQVHPAAADVLTEAVMTALRPAPGDVALDLYCGAGLFAGVLAPAVGQGGTVIGVEGDSAAVRDARHNLREWPWARVHKGDVAEVISRGGLAPARLVVADPPRAGLAREVVDYLAEPGNGAARFAYVSCDPATLARDIALLIARGWTLEDLRAFDAFPMTHHVECVATLIKPPTP